MSELNSTDKEQPLYTIGVVADLCGISTHTIRYYESEGLIIPFRTNTGRRLYSMNDIHRLRSIIRMINDDGLNITGIRMLLAMIPCWKIRPCTPEQRANCPAYSSTIGPCWDMTQKGQECHNVNCRTCKVYRMLAECDSIKEYVKLGARCGDVSKF